MKEKNAKKPSFFLVPAVSLAIILLGLVLSIQVFRSGQDLTLASQDAQLMKTAQSVDNDIIGHFNWYSSDFLFLIQRSGLAIAQERWLSGEDDGSSLLAYLQDSPLLRLRGIVAMTVIQNEKALLSTDGRTDYTFLTSLGMVGQTEVGMSRNGAGKLFVSMFLTWEEVDYAIVIDAEEFFATTEEQSAAGPNDQLMLLDSAGQYYFHRASDGIHIDPVDAILENGQGHLGLEQLHSAQESGGSSIEFYTVEKENSSYTARLVTLPAQDNTNGCFTIGLMNNYDETSRPLRDNLLRMMLGGGLIVAGILLFLFFVLLARRRDQENEEELRILREKGDAMEELNRQTQEFAHHQRLELMGTLTSGIAHEFNNLLTPIMGYSILALEQISEEQTQVYDSLLEIYESSRKAKDIIARLSALSRKSSPENHQPIAPDELVRRVVEVARPAMPPQVTVELELNCPQARVTGNDTQLSQLLLNLIINAFQAMEGAGGRLTLSTAARDGQVCIRVADTGPGISKQVLEHIFDPFFTTKESGKGTGLGLAIVRQVAEGHSGTIQVETQVGRGTAFTLCLPAAPGAAEGETEN